MPGLLQTEAYARAVLTAQGTHGPDQVAHLVAGRMERQDLLTGEVPKRFTRDHGRGRPAAGGR
ncbi:Scr1 family TA system antitoxin-like transcriptional regulator [Micromonospora sp. L31]|uniref:Scr1 family TA system antitoxin-like transcriptional regulator n=1 Tax=Micromonospora TaxID=1873 RepID=UPI003F8B14C9